MRVHIYFHRNDRATYDLRDTAERERNENVI